MNKVKKRKRRKKILNQDLFYGVCIDEKTGHLDTMSYSLRKIRKGFCEAPLGTLPQLALNE
ncbi:MAG: hypothetical protein ACXAAM_08185 [Candidatus Heimdallarchaeaceae archaeon]|jgi:hypothetical protein